MPPPAFLEETMSRFTPSFVRGFFAGVFSMGAVVSAILLLVPTAPEMRPIAAVNLPVALALVILLVRRDLRVAKTSAA